MQEYCKENNIECKFGRDKDPERWRNGKLRKLALYFNKEESEFTELVNQNPDSNFRDLLRILKEKGTYDFDPNDEVALKKMRSKFRR